MIGTLHTGIPPIRYTEEIPNGFIIQGNSAHGCGPPIPIQIGDVRHIGILQKNNFHALCQIINANTLTNTYPSKETRDNHNGTHSARQARMLEVWLNVMKRNRPDILKLFTEEELMHLQLGAYLLRSGRIDESSHLDPSPDDYYTRSSMIYEAYANQLRASQETVTWIKQLLVNSCKPVGIRNPSIDSDPKSKFAWDSLTLVHELDLIRCYSQYTIDTANKKYIQAILDIYLPQALVRRILESLFCFSKKLCEVTGSCRIYDHHPGNSAAFSLCSRDGKRCWEIVSAALAESKDLA